ncbi:MAG: 2-oxoglutarate dehydrogenase E1 component [Burkholderiales bacterium]
MGDSWLNGANAAYVDALFGDYLENPDSVPQGWRSRFARLPQPEMVAPSDRRQISVLQLINAYRFLGLRQAELDPLKHIEKPATPELDPAHYGLVDADMDVVFDTGSFVGPGKTTLRDILDALKETYCGPLGVEYMYISENAQKRWIQARLEGRRSRPDFPPEYRKRILQRLTEAETLERYLHVRYVGQKRFSLEGGDSLIPLLDSLLQRAGSNGVYEVVIGMAHRGRLNVLVNTMGKMPTELFSEFEGKEAVELSSGDVKYHQGFSSDIMTKGGPMHVTLAFNPSHLEIVNPVVEGSVRARQHRRRDFEGKQVLPILIHGDAAFSGQGVVMETLNLSKTRGYGTGGTVHVIINNQIGFTTSDPRDTRSTIYCSDVGKMVEAPIFHVNADDPEALLMAAEIAFDFRDEFQKDVIIDMVCFRRHGHNEQDEPLVTQPLMYKIVNAHPGTRQLYALKLEKAGVIERGEADKMAEDFRAAMDRGEHPNPDFLKGVKNPHSSDWSRFRGTKWNENDDTSIGIDDLKRLSAKLTDIPENFRLHPRVEKIISDRREMGQGKIPLDWGMAENLAYATLLEAGFPVRISGQDVGRGTFFHRHAVLHDQNREKWDEGIYIPLQHIAAGQPDFAAIDSVLSEEAVLGFEYGYATAEPNELVIWEAQFGDFANGAQVVIDQFITSGEAKWGRLCGLVMMLPHGHEGQGPEHSSGRLERYLQLCADYNIQVCVPSTPAQMFHLLRRQMLRPYRRPLVLFTPKSLLRHKDSVSGLEELAKGKFLPVTGEIDPGIESEKVRRVICCAGKVYFDLVNARREKQITDIAIVRINQLYPFPHDDFKAILACYGNAREVLWCQEEPKNQGAWRHLEHYLLRHLSPEQKLLSSMRPSSASPAAGYYAKYLARQKELVDAAFA